MGHSLRNFRLTYCATASPTGCACRLSRLDQFVRAGFLFSRAVERVSVSVAEEARSVRRRARRQPRAVPHTSHSTCRRSRHRAPRQRRISACASAGEADACLPCCASRSTYRRGVRVLRGRAMRTRCRTRLPCVVRRACAACSCTRTRTVRRARIVRQGRVSRPSCRCRALDSVLGERCKIRGVRSSCRRCRQVRRRRLSSERGAPCARVASQSLQKYAGNRTSARRSTIILLEAYRGNASGDAHQRDDATEGVTTVRRADTHRRDSADRRQQQSG
jgi:hypothetical protein